MIINRDQLLNRLGVKSLNNIHFEYVSKESTDYDIILRDGTKCKAVRN